MKNTARYGRILLLTATVALLSFPLQLAAVKPVPPGAHLAGTWTFRDSMYLHEFEFRTDGSFEQRMYMDDTPVWSGTGNYTVKARQLEIRIEQSASNTKNIMQFEIVSSGAKELVLKPRGKYFNNAPAGNLTFLKK